MGSFQHVGRNLWATLIIGMLALGGTTPAAFAEALDKLSGYAFVASRKSSEITILSTGDDRVVGRLDVAAVPNQTIVSENHRKLVATHSQERRASLIDLDTGAVTTTIDLGFSPDLIQIDDETGAVAIGSRKAGKVTLIALGSERAILSIDGLEDPTDLMFDRGGEHLLVAHGHAGVISFFDAVKGTLAKRLALEAAGEGIVELIRTPGGKTGLALHGESGLISALDLFEKAEVGSTTLPGPAERGFPTANSQFFLIPNGDGETMSMVSSWTYRESDSLPGVQDLVGVNSAMFDSVAFALSSGDRIALAVSLLGTPRTEAIALPGHPETGLTVALGTKLYVALSDTNQIAVIDAIGKRLVGVIDDVGNEPWAITAAGGLGYCH